MKFKFDNEFPIHQQLVDQISNYIISGVLKPGEKIPSVREFADLAEVNHNTIQKALNKVEEIGLIITNRTNGKFVTTEIELIDKVRDQILSEKINVFIDDLKKIGVYQLQLIVKETKEKESEKYEFIRS